MVSVGDKVTFVKAVREMRDGEYPIVGTEELQAEVIVVWTQSCVNLKVEDGSMPTSVMKADYFPSLPSGHYWKV